jgi:hypothetical protein
VSPAVDAYVASLRELVLARTRTGYSDDDEEKNLGRCEVLWSALTPQEEQEAERWVSANPLEHAP